MPFNVALSGLRAASTDLEVTGNNVANASTTGFKKSSVQFGDLYASSFLSGSINQIGSGVRVQTISQNFGQGSISVTANSLDLAINGEGFFVLDHGGERRYSRAGHFGVDSQGYIVNNTGMKIQGYMGEANGPLGPLRVSSENLAPRRTEDVMASLNLNSSSATIPQALSSLTPGLDRVLTVTLADGSVARLQISAADTAEDIANALNGISPGVATHDNVTVTLGAGAAVSEHQFDPTDPKTYNHTTSTTIYDSLGNAHVLSMYFIQEQTVEGSEKTPWTMHLQVNGRDVGASAYNLVFNSDGSLDASMSDKIEVNNWVPRKPDGTPNGATGPNGNPNSTFAVDISQLTQYGSPFAVNDMQQDGYTTGRMAGLDVNKDGVIFARYTNGQSQVIGRVALATFKDMDGLASVGDTTWVETYRSGQPLIGTPGMAALGAIQSNALEDSNVDLSDQLVNLIIAQRNYQANAKTIETANAVTQTIINLR